MSKSVRLDNTNLHMDAKISLVAVMLLLALCSCKDSETLKMLEESEQARSEALDELDSAKSKLSALEDKLDDVTGKIAEQEAQIQNLKNEKAGVEAELELKQEELERERTKLDDLREDFEEFKRDYAERARKRFLGQELKQIVNVRESRIYKDVTIYRIDEHSLAFQHEGGQGTLQYGELDPQIATLLGLLPADDEGVAGNNRNPFHPVETEGVAAWQPASLEDVAKCSVFVKVKEGIDKYGNQLSWNGTGFVCNEGGVSYIYSNAHNFDGAVEFEIVDEDGTHYTDLAGVEIAKQPHGYYEEEGWGGDVVRIRLRNYRTKALTIDPEPYRPDNQSALKIGVTGNTGGRGQITRLTGLATEVVPRNILRHNVPTEEGNSGSPIVRMDDFKVIGITTWGAYDPENPLFDIWRRKPKEVRTGINAGALLHGFEFEPTSYERLRKEKATTGYRLVRLLKLIDAVEPGHQGIFVDRRQIVEGTGETDPWTVGELVELYQGHPVINRLIQLDQKLKLRADSKIKYGNHDVIKFWSSAVRDCLAMIVREREQLEAASFHFYYRLSLERSRALEVCRAYELAMDDAIAWYGRQLGTGGDSMRLGERVRLPPIADGLAALGLEPQ